MALGINGAYARVCSPDEIVLSGGFPWLSQSYLGDFDVDAETNRVLDVALEMTRAALGLADDFSNGIIASTPAPPFRASSRPSCVWDYRTPSASNGLVSEQRPA